MLKMWHLDGQKYNALFTLFIINVHIWMIYVKCEHMNMQRNENDPLQFSGMEM